MNVVGKFGRITSRGYASHKSPEKIEAGTKLWQNLTFFLALPAVGLASANAFMKHMHEEERPEYIPYEYLGIRNKPYPWGDGNHSLLHNPKKNAIPGVGYEE